MNDVGHVEKTLDTVVLHAGRNAQQSGENAAHVKSPDIAEDDGEEPEKKKGKIQFMVRLQS